MLVIIGKTPDFRSNFRNTVARNILDNKREKENNGMERKKKKDKKRENENGTMTIQIFQISARTIHTSTQSVRVLKFAASSGNTRNNTNRHRRKSFGLVFQISE